MLWPKKNSYKEFDNEKKFLGLENFPPPPPHNVSKCKLERCEKRTERQETK